MKTVFLSSLLILISSGIYSKDDGDTLKFEFGFFIRPDAGYRFLTNYDDISGLNETWIDWRNNNEKFGLRGTSGLSFALNLWKNTSIESGISYTMMGYNFNNDIVISHTTGGIEDIAHLKSNYYYHYFDLPVYANHTILRFKKGKIRLRYGVINSFLLRITSRSTLTYYDDSEYNSESKNINPTSNGFYLYYPKGSVGVEYSRFLSDDMKWGVSLEPQINIGIRSLLESPIHEHLYSLGLHAGLKRFF